jgi:hypothetical protein
MNATGVMIIGFEKYIVDAMRAAEARITDPAIAAEADAFLRQEAQHSRAHRQHVRALVRRYPGLQDTTEQIVRSYDALFDAKPLDYHLAYIADLEATFTPTFKMTLDHADELFRPGDERVASLFIWHFVEEIEHRSSALAIYEHVVARKWYRLTQLPSVLRHIGHVLQLVTDGFNEHVPLADRKVDARNILPGRQVRRQLAEHIPRVDLGMDLSLPAANAGIPLREQLQTYARVLGSQTPNHDPEHQPLPALAEDWFARYDRGDDVSHWYG